jgi:hypothetical protein
MAGALPLHYSRGKHEYRVTDLWEQQGEERRNLYAIICTYPSLEPNGEELAHQAGKPAA